MRRYGALILDMDGTIMDSLAVVEQSTRRAGAAHGVAIGERELALAKYSANEVLLEALGLRDGEAEAFSRTLSDCFEELGHMAGLFPGVEELLALPVKKGIVTSENREELTINLKRLGIRESVFEATVCAGETEHLKPHPRPLLRCLELMGADRAAAVYVGDSLYDMQCAAAAGVDFGLARWGAGTAEGFDQARYILKTPGDVRALMEGAAEQRTT